MVNVAGEKPVWVLVYKNSGGAEQRLEMTSDALTAVGGVGVGRKSDKNTFNLDDGSISRAHAVFSLDADGNLQILDLGSANGSFVNGRRLEPQTQTSLAAGKEILLGSLSVDIEFPVSETVVAAPPPVAPPSTEEDWPEDATIAMDISDIQEPLIAQPETTEKEVVSEGQSVSDQRGFIETILTYGSRKPVISFLLTLIVTTIAAFGAVNLQIDTSYDSMFSRKDPSYKDYQTVVKEFGSDNISIIYFQDKNLFSEERLLKLEGLTFALQDLDFIEKSDSLFTVLNIRDSDGSLDLNPLMDTVPETAEEIAIVKDNALYSPLIRRNYLSEDGTTTAIVVTVTNVEGDPGYNRRIFGEIEKVLEPVREDFERVFQVGPPRLNVEIEEGMFSDLRFISPLATVILVGSIVFFLRTFVAAALPLTTAGLSIFWTIGFMGFMGIPLNLLTAILPALVIVIGSTEDTHMLSSYLDGLPKKEPIDRHVAIRFMAVHVGLPIFITSFTTTVGFLSNAVSDISLIADFGIATSFAMTANLVVTILVLPLMLRVIGPKKSRLHDDKGEMGPLATKGLAALDNITDKHQSKVILVTLALVAAGIYMSQKVQVSNDPLSYFKPDNVIVGNAQTLHKDLAGMQVFYLTIEAEPGKDFKDPDQLKKLVEVESYMESLGVFDKVISIADYLKLVNREMNSANQNFYVPPDSRQLIDQYMLLFQRSDIEQYINPDASRANVLVRHNLSDSWVLNKNLELVNAYADKVLEGKMRFYLTGKNLMINRSAETLFSSQVYSLGLLIGIIFIIMSLLYTSLTAGVLSLVPNLIPIAILFGVMGAAGIPLNPGTAIVAVIAVGIAIDDTIHLLSTYNAECKKDPDQAAATRRSVRAEAIPVVSTSMSLAAGFGVLYFSEFNIVSQFGILSAMTMLVAMLTDLLVTPVLLKQLRLVGIWDVISFRVGGEVLTQSELFEGMSKFQIRKAILLSHIQEFGPGEVIVRQGDVGNDMYLILSGIAETVHFDGQHKKILARRTCGEAFGEAGYVADTVRMATVRCAKDGNLQVLRLNADTVAKGMRFYPRISAKLSQNINRILSRRLAETGNKLVHVPGK